MSPFSFNKVGGVIFGVVALAHGARIGLGLPIQIGSVSIPMSVSWLGLLITGALCAWGLSSRS